MRLAEIRAAPHVLAADIEAGGLTTEAGTLRRLAEETRRRRPVRRAPVRAKAVTPEMQDAIFTAARAHPEWSLHQIGAHVGVNQGRVSEVLAGFRQ